MRSSGKVPVERNVECYRILSVLFANVRSRLPRSRVKPERCCHSPLDRHLRAEDTISVIAAAAWI
jgi:hypothetical protein